MSNRANVYRQVISTAPYTESENAQLTKNIVDMQINGTSPSAQSYGVSLLSSDDYEAIKQAMSIIGYFVSFEERPIYEVKLYGTENNPIKSIESDVGIPFDYLSSISANEKYPHIVEDFRVKQWWIEGEVSDLDVSYEIKNKKIEANVESWGEESFKNKVMDIKSQYDSWNAIQKQAKSKKNTKIHVWNIDETINKGLGQNKGWRNPSFEKTAQLAKVIFKEDRMDSYEDISSRGSYDRDEVCVEVYQMPDNISFTTAQSFSTVEPRGSQTPMRFYEKNPARVVDIQCKFHQQEYPLEPLLSIGEKLQYLARPYQHTDYSLIPKLVRLSVPGRIFRGYITTVGVNYRGDDYTAWESPQQVYEGLAYTTKTQSGEVTTYAGLDSLSYPNMEQHVRSWERGELKGFSNDSNAMYYGLSELNVNIQMAIVEDIKLTVYTTFAEQQEQGAAKEAEEEEKKKQAEIDTIRTNLINTYPDIINKDNVDNYIFVDENGYVTSYFELPAIVDKEGVTEVKLLYLEEWEKTHKEQPDVFGTSLASYNNKTEAEKSNANTASPSIDVSKGYTTVLSLTEQVTDQDSVINLIMQMSKMVGSQVLGAEKYNQNIDKDYLKTLSMEELNSRREELTLLLAGENKDKVAVINKFVTVQEKAQTGEKYIQPNVPDYIKSLLSVVSITTVEDILKFLSTAKDFSLRFDYTTDIISEKKTFFFYSMHAQKKIQGRNRDIGFLYSDFKIDVYSNEHGVAHTYSIIDNLDGKLAQINLNQLSDSKLEQKYKDFLKKIFGNYLPIFKVNKETLLSAIKYIDSNGKPHPEDKTLETFFIEMYNNCVSQMNSNLTEAFTNVCSPCFESQSLAKKEGYTNNYYTFTTTVQG